MPDDIIHQESTSQHTRAILLPLDHSAHAEHAFQWALVNIARPDDLLVLANVRPVATVPGPYGTMYMDFTDYLGQAEEQYRQDSHRLLREFSQKAKDAGYGNVKAIAMRGDARDEIMRKAAEVQADIIIVGSRGLGAIKRVVIGSTSDYLVHNASCAVIVVKDKEQPK